METLLYDWGIDPRILIAVVAVLAAVLVLKFVAKLAVRIVLLVLILSLSGVLSFNVTEVIHDMQYSIGQVISVLPAEENVRSHSFFLDKVLGD